MANKRISELSSRTPALSDLMLIGDPTTGYSYKCTLLEAIGLGVPATRTITINGTTFDLSANRTWNVGTVTSVGLSMPAAFTVSGSPVTNNGTLAVTAAGTASQYIRGDGQLANFPTNGGGGGASVSYYLNGSVNQGTFGGATYYEANKTPVLGTGTNFTTSSNGYIASFITDAGDPGSLLIPGGNWNFEVFFAASSGGGTPTYYVELYKYDGTTFSLIASSSSNPDVISGGTSVEAYFSTLAVPETPLAITDRLAIRIYVTTAGRTITLHTEDNNLCQIITTFSTGITALNGLTKQVQYFATGTSGTDFGIVSSNDTHTFNLPSSSATNRGLLTAADWTTFNGKQNALNGTGFVRMSGTTVSYVTGTSSQFVKADGTLDSSVYVTSNIYTADGTLTGNRTVTMGTNTLTFQSNTTGSSLTITNTNNTQSSYIQFGGTNSLVGKSNQSYTPFKNIRANSTFIYNGTLGDIAIINDAVTQNGRITFLTGGASVEQMTIFASGNIGINTTTDAGFRLDVNGTARIQGATTFQNPAFTGSLTISHTANNTHQISAVSRDITFGPSNVMFVNIDSRFSFSARFNGGIVQAANTAYNIADFIPGNDTKTGFGLTGTYDNVGAGGTNIAHFMNLGGSVVNATTGNYTYNALRIATTVNLTGGTNMIRGLFYSPTLTSTTGMTHRAIETVTGDVIFGSTSGNVGIGLTNPTRKLHVIGDASVSGNTFLSVSSGTTTIGATGDTAYKLSVDGDLRVYGNIRTAQPTGGTAVGIWRLGSTSTGTYTMSTTVAVEIEIGGTLYRLATVS